MNAAQAAADHVTQAASEAAGELAAQQSMVGAAMDRVEQIGKQLASVRIDFEATQQAALKAQAAAQAAAANAAAAAAAAAAGLAKNLPPPTQAPATGGNGGGKQGKSSKLRLTQRNRAVRRVKNRSRKHNLEEQTPC